MFMATDVTLLVQGTHSVLDLDSQTEMCFLHLNDGHYSFSGE